MAKIKKYWIRYNADADRLEEDVTESRFRPQGFGWKEVAIDKCCNQPITIGCSYEELIFQSAIIGVGPTYDVTFTLNGSPVTTIDNAVSLQAAINALNAVNLGLAVFSLTPDNRIQAITSVCGDFAVIAVANP